MHCYYVVVVCNVYFGVNLVGAIICHPNFSLFNILVLNVNYIFLNPGKFGDNMIYLLIFPFYNCHLELIVECCISFADTCLLDEIILESSCPHFFLFLKC